MRQDQVVKGALLAKHHNGKKNFKKNKQTSGENTTYKGKGKKKNQPPCEHSGKLGHPSFRCWKRPDAKCNKCNQLGHEAVICGSKQHEVNAQVVEQDDEDHIFSASIFSAKGDSECCLIDSGCTNHMSYDKTLFKDLKPTKVSKVRIGNGDYISAKGKGTIEISMSSGTKIIFDVLYVPDIDQNLLSVGQLMEKGFKVSFEH